VAWSSFPQDGDNYGIFARRFSSTEGPVATEFQVNLYTPGSQNNPRVAVDVDGDFVIAWNGVGPDGEDAGVFARRFSSTGAPLAPQFQVNVYTYELQRYPSLAIGKNGEFVVAWVEAGGDDYDIVAQRFASPAILDIDADGDVTALTDGLLVLRYLFDFTGTNLTAGLVDTTNCHRCDAAAITAYMQTLI
jgi:hypothetical protein